MVPAFSSLDVNMPYKICVTDFINDQFKPENDLLGDIASITGFNANHESELWPAIDDFDAIMLYHNLSLSRQTLSRLTRCKLIVRCGVGYDNVDHKFAREIGIPVANVPDYGTEEVADSAIGLTLSLTRGISFLNSRLQEKQGPWSYSQVAPLQRLRGRVYAAVGMGRIGIAAALRAKALGMDVVFFDPFAPFGYDKAVGIRRASTLDELLASAFVLSMHCPLTPKTHHLINREAIAKMPRGSYLVNTARGAVVDTSCIPDAIASGHLAGAGIDVLESEPARDEDPLIRAWRDPNHPAYHRVIINPHSAFYSEQGLMDMRIKGCAACRAAVLGEAIPNVVN